MSLNDSSRFTAQINLGKKLYVLRTKAMDAGAQLLSEQEILENVEGHRMENLIQQVVDIQQQCIERMRDIPPDDMREHTACNLTVIWCDDIVTRLRQIDRLMKDFR